MEREIKVFDPRYGWGVVVELDRYITYSIIVKFTEYIANKTYTNNGKAFLDLNQTLSFIDYTKNEPADWVTLEKLEAMNKPELVKGKLYKVWDDDMIKGCYAVAVCTSVEKQSFTINSLSLCYDNYSEI